MDSLSDAADDVVAAAEYLRGKYGAHLRCILVGFSFGGPTVWAAARRLGPEKVCGVAAIAGSARGGERFVTEALDTAGGVVAMDGVPRLWVHGRGFHSSTSQLSLRRCCLPEPQQASTSQPNLRRFRQETSQRSPQEVLTSCRKVDACIAPILLTLS